MLWYVFLGHWMHVLHRRNTISFYLSPSACFCWFWFCCSCLKPVILSIGIIHMRRKKLIHTWSLLPCAHTAVAWDNSHKYNPKGWHCCCAPSGLNYTCGNEMRNLTAVLRTPGGLSSPWAESEISWLHLANLHFLLRCEHVLSQSRSSCLLW